MIFNDWLTRRRLYTPDHVAILDDSDGVRYTYRELDERATRVARYLRHHFTVSPGDRIACLAKNRLEYIDLYFACGKLGTILVPLNFRLPAAAIVELLEDCRPKAFAYESAFAGIAEAARQAGVAPHPLLIDAVDSDNGIPCMAEALETTETSSGEFACYEANQNDVAMILYTSGTTGRAKGAMISYRQIHWNALNTIIGLQLSQDDVAFLNMPLYHTGGWHVLFTPLILLGGRLILQQRYIPERCNELIGREGVTILFGVPTMLQMMLSEDNFASADLSTVRFAIFGGESCPLPLIEAFQARGIAMRQGYGLTEAGPNCFSLPADDAIRKQGSIGFPNFHVGARLIKEDGGEADDGEVGELQMKGPHVFAGYWQNTEETTKTCRDGWIATGDLMTRDEDGYYYVIGRKKDMYVSGGENVYPAQVERILQAHEAVALAAVIGVPDRKWGETGWAFVMLNPERSVSEAELIAWCRQHLATFQCPTKVLMLEDLPLGPSGKIDKLALAERFAEARNE